MIDMMIVPENRNWSVHVLMAAMASDVIVARHVDMMADAARLVAAGVLLVAGVVEDYEVSVRVAVDPKRSALRIQSRQRNNGGLFERIAAQSVIPKGDSRDRNHNYG